MREHQVAFLMLGGDGPRWFGRIYEHSEYTDFKTMPRRIDPRVAHLRRQSIRGNRMQTYRGLDPRFHTGPLPPDRVAIAFRRTAAPAPYDFERLQETRRIPFLDFATLPE
jgi:hypothetical protein